MSSLLARMCVAMITVTLLVVAEGPTSVEAASATVECAPQPAGGSVATSPMVSYTAINPVRLVDTRNNIGGVAVQIDRGCTLRLDLRPDVPADAQAVALSMTAVSSEADYLTVYPCAAGRPATSNLNSRAGVPTPNLVVAVPDANRQVCIFSHGRTHLIVDLAGWWSDGPNRFGSIEPHRVYDSRRPGFTALAPLQVREVVVPSDVIAADATAAVINLTTSNSTRGGYMVAFPCGQPTPLASNLNFVAGEDRAVGAIVGLGPGRTLCVMSDVPTNFIVDVTGYYAPAPAFGPTASLQPDVGRRVVDTRNGVGGPRARFAAGEVRSIDPVAGLVNGNDASAVTLNFISTNAAAAGYLTVFPCGGTVPEVSSLNFAARQEATNLATVQLGPDREICVYASAPTDVIVDVFGAMNVPSGSPLERMTFDKPTWPPFHPDATDYVIECGAGTGTADVTVSLQLLPFSSVSVSVAGGPGADAGNGSTTVALQTDQPLVVSTTRQGTTRDYHLRCVPLDFPKLSVTRPGNPTPGWYLTTFGIFGSPSGPFSVIFDEYGAPVWYRRTAAPVFDAKRLSNGDLVYNPALGMVFGEPNNAGHWITRLDGTFVRTDQTVDHPVNFPDDHHDYGELPPGTMLPNSIASPGAPVTLANGGRSMLSYPFVGDVDLTALNAKLAGHCTVPPGQSTCFIAHDKLVDGVIQEIDAAGNLIWQWRMSDHFEYSEATFPIRFDVAAYRNAGATPSLGVVDVFHINGMQRLADGDYIVTARHIDGAFRIDRETGNVEWIVGMTTAARAPATNSTPRPQPMPILGDPFGGPKRPHDAQLNGDVLSFFDNRTGSTPPARSIGYRLDTAGATLIWSIPSPTGGASDSVGSTRTGADGSRIINWGNPIQPMYQEYDVAGRLMLSIAQLSGGTSYRMIKYPKADFDINVLRSNAGGVSSGPP